MAKQCDLLEFFEMMQRRAAQGEFRFIMVGSVGLDDSIRVTVAGMASEEEAHTVLGELERVLDNG